MVMATLQEAKAKLNQLVDKAIEGETVILMRGTKIVAMIQPITSEDLEVTPELTDQQAKRFWEEVEKEKTKHFSTATHAIQALKKIK